jgi:hypothetical protein
LTEFTGPSSGSVYTAQWARTKNPRTKNGVPPDERHEGEESIERIYIFSIYNIVYILSSVGKPECSTVLHN